MTNPAPQFPEEVPLLTDPVMTREELAELTGIPVDQIADAFDPEDDEES